ncbi:MAG: ATP-binding protein, partial [Deltaproteobacteria bacterium]|nr:ATP-binding protein [Deltaproteobacteria bacterium]
MDTDYEKLGSFYLGTELDPATKSPRGPVMYDARDLTTHAVCLGMTGSGKTGLCLALIEEALIDGVPVIAIDPKGDLANLALTFPELRPADFAPWVDPATAQREGVTVEQLSASTAQRWREGLEASGQSPDRIARLRSAAEVAIYTPGSEAGIPVSLLRSFRAPPAALADDAEAWRDRVEAAASGLLSLIGVAADPLRSREHVLLSQLLEGAWREGRDIELAALIQQVVKPPFTQVGAFDLETFFPAKDRTELALQLNTLIASPSFAAWTRGEPLEIANLLFTRDGKPRAAVMSIAHLSDAERMFFVTLLLQEIVSWMRTQQGTSSLRAIVFMDEVMGYLPPTAMPPSKKPMLTLLKQARAFGVGMVVATQNPVDLDYKALSNAGTWLLGRLQTERDKARVLEGLEGASAATGHAFDRNAMETLLAGLAPRQFVMNNVHDPQPTVLQSRFALSYLAGPLTRAQIVKLGKPAPRASAPAPAANGVGSSTRPVVPSGLPELFMGTGSLAPALVGVAKVHYSLAKADVDVWTDVTVVAPLTPESAGDFWENAAVVDRSTVASASSTAPDAATFAAVPHALNAKTIDKLDDGLASFIFRSGTLSLRSVPSLGLVSRPNEAEEAFRARLAMALREARDAAVAKLKSKYQPKLDALASKHRTALDRVERERSQARSTTADSAISVGASVLGAIFGGRRSSIGRAASAARSVSKTLGQRGDVARAEESAAKLETDLRELEAELEAETAAVRAT